MSAKPGTWADIKIDPATQKQIEAAFRRGYYYGVNDSIDALERGITDPEMIDFLNGPIWEWFLGDKSKVIKPPSMLELLHANKK